nr:type II toxin-antitoxin system PrlF family antitoxin [archaeon]
MMGILAISKVYGNYQTSIPKEIRNMFDVDKQTVIEWSINSDGKPEINFRKKRNIEDIIGIVHLDEKTNSVDLKRGLYK